MRDKETIEKLRNEFIKSRRLELEHIYKSIELEEAPHNHIIEAQLIAGYTSDIELLDYVLGLNDRYDNLVKDQDDE